jgi:hypothetical protein
MSEGFRNVPGVPDGWELVRVGQPVYNVDHIVDPDGNPKLCDFDSSYLNRVIIRKIEQPAKYRAFANAREADQFWNASLRLAGVTGDTKDSRFRITSIGRDGITINASFYTYEQAFKCFCIDDDGTPFGVRIDE